MPSYNVDKSLYPSHAISLSFPKLLYRPFFYFLYDENCRTLSLRVSSNHFTFMSSYFPYIYEGTFFRCFISQLSLSLSLVHICHSLKMDQRKVANIIIQFEELKVKAKKGNRERVLPPKRGRIKRRIFSCLIHNLMKIARGNV